MIFSEMFSSQDSPVLSKILIGETRSDISGFDPVPGNQKTS